MSLINQMLQDLDQRGAELSGTGAVQPAPSVPSMMSAPAASPASPTSFGYAKWLDVLALLVVLMGLIASASWYWRQHQGVKNTLEIPAPNKLTQQTSLKPIQVPSATKSSDVALAVASTTVAANDIATVATLANASQLPSLLVLKLSTDFDPDKMVAQPTLVAAENKNAESKLVKPAKTVKENQTAVLAKNNVGSEPSKFIKEISPQQKAEGEYRQATVLQQQGRAAEAIQMLEQALQTDAQHTAALQLLIGLLIESKRQDEAMRWLQQALQADSGQPRLAMILARLQVDRAQVGSAIETLQKSLPQASEQSDYLAFLAALLQREARHKAAVDLYQRALKKNPQNSVWWMGLGISLQAEQRNAEALDAYSRAKAVGGLSNELLAFIEQKISQLAH